MAAPRPRLDARRVLFRGINAASYIGFLYKCLVIWKGNSWIVGGESFEVAGSLGRLKRPEEKFAGMCFVAVAEVAVSISLSLLLVLLFFIAVVAAVVIVVVVAVAFVPTIVVVTIIVMIIMIFNTFILSL